MKDGQSKSIWKDLSGNGNDGELIDFDFTADSGWVDGGLKFDGVDDWVVTTKGIQFNQPFTFCLDGDFSELTYENWGIARKEVRPPFEFSFYQRDSSSFRFVIWQSEGAAAVNFVIPAEIVHNSNSLIFVNHMDSIVLFANGVNVKEMDIDTSLWDNHIATDRPLEFGVGGFSGVQKYGDLILYGVKFYNRALTDEEILQNYQATHFLLEPKTFTSTSYYNFYDLNRVEINTLATKDLAEVLRGDINLDNINFDRDMKSIPFADTLNRIEGNINKLGNKLYKPKGWSPPKLEWDYNQPFDFTDANRLEKNLLLLYNYANGNVDKIPYCGMYTCGEEVI